MAIQVEIDTDGRDPEGSIFFFEPLSETEFREMDFALLANRGAYFDIDPDHRDAVYRELQLRRSLTRLAITHPVTPQT